MLRATLKDIIGLNRTKEAMQGATFEELTYKNQLSTCNVILYKIKTAERNIIFPAVFFLFNATF